MKITLCVVLIVILSVIGVQSHSIELYDGENKVLISPVATEAAFVDDAIKSREKREIDATVDVQTNKRGGTDASVKVGGNIFTSEKGRVTIDGNAHADKHWGPGGSTKPNYGVGVTGTIKLGDLKSN